MNNYDILSAAIGPLHIKRILEHLVSRGDQIFEVPSGYSVDFYIAGSKFFDLTNDGTKATLMGLAGDYWRIGDAAASSQGLASEDDLLVSGKLEVNSTSHFVGNINLGSGINIVGYSSAGSSHGFQIRDTGVEDVTVASMHEGADPYFRIGRDDTGVALNAVTDMLVLQAGGGTGNAAANFGFGMPIQLSNAASEQEERASIDFVLTDATDASEDVEINFKLQIAGAATAEVLSIVGTGLDLPTGKILTVAGTQVVGARVVDARCDDAINSGDATTDGVIDALRDCLITHGLIAAA